MAGFIAAIQYKGGEIASKRKDRIEDVCKEAGLVCVLIHYLNPTGRKGTQDVQT